MPSTTYSPEPTETAMGTTTRRWVLSGITATGMFIVGLVLALAVLPLQTPIHVVSTLAIFILLAVVSSVCLFKRLSSDSTREIVRLIPKLVLFSIIPSIVAGYLTFMIAFAIAASIHPEIVR
jgi:hypothetical protein